MQFDELYAKKEHERKEEDYHNKQGRKGRATTDVAMEEIPMDDFGEFEMEDVANVVAV